MNHATPLLVVIFVTATFPHCDLPGSNDLPKSSGKYVVTGSMPSPLANQAAAADDKFVYVVDNGVIAKHDRATGKELARSVGKAEHLNSGFLWESKLYCSHSNYPKKPHQSDIRVLDPATMKLDIFHVFEDPPGNLTWAVRRDQHWWCCFAHYGKENEKSSSSSTATAGKRSAAGPSRRNWSRIGGITTCPAASGWATICSRPATTRRSSTS